MNEPSEGENGRGPNAFSSSSASKSEKFGCGGDNCAESLANGHKMVSCRLKVLDWDMLKTGAAGGVGIFGVGGLHSSSLLTSKMLERC